MENEYKLTIRDRISGLVAKASEPMLWTIMGVSAFLLISPIDLIPEAIAGPIGLLDDGGYLIMFIMALFAEIYKRREKKKAVEFDIEEDNLILESGEIEEPV